MRWPFLLFLAFFISSITYGQSKWVKKSDKLFVTGKYEKCIDKSQQYLKKEPKSEDIQFYIVASNLALYKIAQTPFKQYSYLKKCVQTWSKLEQYNTKEKDFSELKDTIVYAIHKLSETDYILRNRTKLEFLNQKLSEVFSDTTESYRVFHTVIEKNHKIEIDSFIVDLRQQILLKAEQLIGVPYKYGGTDTTGFDCSGFTQFLYKSINIDLPHNANQQSKLGKKIPLKQAKAGDLIYFGKTKAFHAAMIFKNNAGEIELIHCVSRGVDHQAFEDVNTQYWLGRVLCVKQFIDE